MTVASPAVSDARRPVRAAALACAAGAVLIAAVLVALGQPLTGGAVAAGLVLGTLNGAAAARLIALPIPFVASSLMRILTLSMVGIAVGLAFGISRIWLVILGLGLAQFVLAAAALRATMRR